jgi:hypothetical protein
MREIPHFPCIEPDLAKAIVLTEERKIVEKPADIWNNPEDYVVQYKYDGVRCLIAPNTFGLVMSAEGGTPYPPKDFGVRGKLPDWPLNWWASSDMRESGSASKTLENLQRMEAFFNELFIQERMKSFPAAKPGAKRVTSSVSRSSPLKYVSREDKTRNRINMQYITEDIMAYSPLKDQILDNKLVLDGEVWSEDIRLPEITGLWSAEQLKADAELLNFVCFDCYWVDAPHLNYPDRMQKLFDLIGSKVPRIKFVLAPQTISVTSEVLGWSPEAKLSMRSSRHRVTPKLERLLDYAIRIDAEGLIIRKWNLPYNCGRTGNNLYKLKSFEDSEFIIVDVLEGIGKFAGVPIWICDNGVGGTFKVTAAGTIPEKEQKWKDRADWIGKPLKVKYERLAKSGTPLKPVSLGLRTSL